MSKRERSRGSQVFLVSGEEEMQLKKDFIMCYQPPSEANSVPAIVDCYVVA